MNILILVITYPIFISVWVFGVLKPRIDVFDWIVLSFFLMEIFQVSVTPCLQRLVFIFCNL